MYGYVTDVATSLDSAPSTKKSKSARRAAPGPPRAWRRRTSAFFSCSNTVYCSTGFTTSTSAGPIPRQNAASPPVCKMCAIVSAKPRFFAGALPGAGRPGAMVCVACEVWMTQMGLLMIVVADPSRDMNGWRDR